MLIDAILQMSKAILNDTNRRVVRIEAGSSIFSALHRGASSRADAVVAEGVPREFMLVSMRVVPVGSYSERLEFVLEGD